MWEEGCWEESSMLLMMQTMGMMTNDALAADENIDHHNKKVCCCCCWMQMHGEKRGSCDRGCFIESVIHSSSFRLDYSCFCDANEQLPLPALCQQSPNRCQITLNIPRLPLQTSQCFLMSIEHANNLANLIVRISSNATTTAQG